MEKFVYYTKLYDCYKGLLSPNERTTFSLYYEENLSMQEIADNKKISKSAVGMAIKNAEMKLASFERVLHLEAKNDKLKEIIKQEQNEELKKELEKLLK